MHWCGNLEKACVKWSLNLQTKILVCKAPKFVGVRKYTDNGTEFNELINCRYLDVVHTTQQ